MHHDVSRAALFASAVSNSAANGALLGKGSRPMPVKKKLSVKVTPVVATVIQPVTTQLNRIEDLLIEMRGALDVHLKRIAALQTQVDILIEKDRVR